jgi:hypothetical protein
MKQITEKCPFCGLKGTDYNEVIIKKARDATVLMGCENEHLWGRYT